MHVCVVHVCVVHVCVLCSSMCTMSPSCSLTVPVAAPELAAYNSQHQNQQNEKEQGHCQRNNEWDEEVLARIPNYTGEEDISALIDCSQ